MNRASTPLRTSAWTEGEGKPRPPSEVPTKRRFMFVDYEVPYLLRATDDPRRVTGGAAVDVLILMNELIALGHEVALMTGHGAGEYIGRPSPFTIIESDLRRIRTHPAAALGAFLSALRAIAQYRPHYVIQKSAGGSTGIVALLARLSRVRFVYRMASNDDADGTAEKKMSRFARRLYQYGLSQSDPIQCQNHYQRDHVRCRFPFKSVTVIHDSIQVHDARPIQPQTERRYFAWVGRFAREKNLPALLRIAREMPEVEFRVAGGPSLHEFDDATRNAVEGLARLGNVQLVGYLGHSEILSFLANAYALLNTSHVEGFSRTFLEALVVGTPIVTTQEVDPDSIVARYDLGAIASDHRELGAAIASIMRRHDYRDLIQRCQRYVIENHDSTVLIRSFVESLV